jgi:hypothetical protein
VSGVSGAQLPFTGASLVLPIVAVALVVAGVSLWWIGACRPRSFLRFRRVLASLAVTSAALTLGTSKVSAAAIVCSPPPAAITAPAPVVPEAPAPILLLVGPIGALTALAIAIRRRRLAAVGR